MILAKVAMGLGGTLVLAGAYVFHDGVIRITVDEARPNGDHVHLVVPATIVSAGLHFVPERDLGRAMQEARPYMPMFETFTKELSRLPDFELVSVDSSEQHVRVRTEARRLIVDVHDSGENVHVSLPLSALRHLAEDLQERRPAN
jgi:hypothetical protein